MMSSNSTSHCRPLKGPYPAHFLALILILAIGIIGVSVPKSALADNPKYASIVIDAGTGMVLSQSNADRTLHPASLTKIMTMMLVFDALNSGKVTTRTRLVASSHSASMPPSKIGIRPGRSISVHDALRVMATKSANDVAVTVAENLGGSEARFVQLMNLKARQIGMTHTRFTNASGLNDFRQVSSARDMARLAKYLIDTYPKYYKYFGIKNIRYNGHNYHNHNRLMSQYSGMDGIKTGYVSASGFNLVASVKRDGVRLIGVVFGGRTAKSRNAHMETLLDRGFQKMGQLQRSGYLKTLRVHATPVPLPRRKPEELVTAQAAVPETPAATTVTSAATPSATAPSSPTALASFPVPTPPVPPTSAELPVRYAEDATLPARKPDRLSHPKIMQQIPAPAPVATQAMKSYQVTRNQTSHYASQAAPANKEPEATQLAYSLGQVVLPSPKPHDDVSTSAEWQIQIGAYGDRSSSDQALYNAMVRLPQPLNKGKTIIVPLRTADAKWIFRARLGGYTQQEASQACSYLKDCLTIPPQEN